jgi:hypothetical protein
VHLLLGCLGVVAIVIGILAIAVVATMAVKKSPSGGSGSLSAAMLTAQSILDPDKKHAAEAIQVQREDEDHAGDDPDDENVSEHDEVSRS